MTKMHDHELKIDEHLVHTLIKEQCLSWAHRPLDLCSKPHHEWKPLFDWFIDGYRSILPINDDDLKSINWFTQMKSLFIYLWCKNNWCEPTAPGGKPRDQWLAELRHMALTPIFPQLD